MGPTDDEKPAPIEIEPVDFSSTSTLMTALSGALPGLCSIFTFAKKPRLSKRFFDRRSLDELKASPSMI